jgi:hypothetical protein
MGDEDLDDIVNQMSTHGNTRKTSGAKKRGRFPMRAKSKFAKLNGALARRKIQAVTLPGKNKE